MMASRETVHFQAEMAEETACGKRTTWTNWDAPERTRGHKVTWNRWNVTCKRCLAVEPPASRLNRWAETMIRPRGAGVARRELG